MLTTKDFPGVDKFHQSFAAKLLCNPEAWAHGMLYPEEPSDTFKIGTAAHVAILQPDLFDETYAIAPSGLDRRKKEDKELWAEMIRKNGEERILAYPQAKIVKGIAKAVADCASAKTLLEIGVAEKEVEWADYETGMPMAGRIDWKSGDMVVDLKTTSDASFKGFQRSIMSYGYDIQAAAYLEAVVGKRFLWICVESVAPHTVAVYEADDALVAHGRKRLTEAINVYKRCLADGVWHGYSDGVVPMILPEWCKE